MHLQSFLRVERFPPQQWERGARCAPSYVEIAGGGLEQWAFWCFPAIKLDGRLVPGRCAMKSPLPLHPGS